MKKRVLSCSRLFLSYFEIKKEKKDSLFACYLFFCLSLRHYYFRYLRSNIHVYILTTNTLYYLHFSPSNSSRKINSFYLLQYVLSKQSL